MRFEDHLLVDRFFLGKELPKIHQQTDEFRKSPSDLSRFDEHIWHHTPIYAINKIAPEYGMEGLKSHFLHVLGDLSPLQVRDFRR